MRILGIDPGTTATGFGIVEDTDGVLAVVRFGAIAPPPRLPFSQRLLHIHDALRAIVTETRPDCAAVEAVFFARNIQSALRLGQARGVALVAVAESGLPVHEYSALQVKQAVTGYGQAGKAQVQAMMKMLLDLPECPEPPDAADALALAVCHRQAARLQARLATS
jgi:crossover junction endodeoxyribonuclease RuvC